MAKDVEWTATPAGARRQGEGKPQATKEENTEELRAKPSKRGGRHHGEREARHGTGLRTQKGRLSGTQPRHDGRGDEMFLNGPGSKELPTMGGNSRLNVLERKLSGAKTMRERCPLCCLETH